MAADQVHLLAFLLTVATMILGFAGVWYRMRFNSEAHSKSIDELRIEKTAQGKEITELRLSISKEYVSKADMKEVEGRIGDKIDERTGSLERLITSLFGGGSNGPVPPRRKPAP